MSRSAAPLTAAIAFIAILVVGCSASTRHGVLSFFFDGVPEPGAEATEPRADERAPGGVNRGGSSEAMQRPAEPTVFRHPGVKEYKCRQCHVPGQAALTRTPEQGLCSQCHAALTSRVRFVHGPVAVGGCLECHSHHESPHRGLLREEASKICVKCHEVDDLDSGEHHMLVVTQGGTSCLRCHDPHGGEDRMFLRRSAEQPPAETPPSATTK